MNKVKKIEKRLSKLQRLQKQLEKKRKQFNRKKKQNRLQGRIVKMAAKKTAAAKKAAIAQNNAPESTKSVVSKALAGAVIGTVCGIAVTMAIKAVRNRNEEYKALANDGEFDFELQETQAEYDKASLEELEEALLRVENELDEVSAAIERSKK